MPLVSWWPLHEDSGSTAYDVRGDNDGTTNGGVTQGATGILGNTAYDFDGADDWVQCPNPNGITIGNNLSISFWLNLDNTNSGQTFVEFGTGSSDRISIGMDDGGSADTLNAHYYDGSHTTTSDTTFTDTTWTHVVLTLTSSNVLKLYINGVERTGTANYNNTGGDADASLGSNNSGGAYTNGKICEVRIYDHALTASEVQYLYNVTKSGSWTSTPKQL